MGKTKAPPAPNRAVEELEKKFRELLAPPRPGEFEITWPRGSLHYKGEMLSAICRRLKKSPEELLEQLVEQEPIGPVRSAQEIWKAVLGELQPQVTRSTYRNWLEKTEGLSFQDNQFVVGVPNMLVAEYLSQFTGPLIEKQLFGLTQSDLEIRYRVVSDIQAEVSTPRPLLTHEAIDKFLKAKMGKLRPESIRSYGAVLRPFARAYPELPLEPEPIEEYLDNFSHDNTTARYKFSVLRTFYLWLSRRNLIAVNPIKMVERPGGQADEVLPLNEEQARVLHDMPKTDREQGYVGLMLDHGFRLSEVIRLDVGDIHEDRIWVHGKERKEWFPLLSEVRGWLLKLADGRGPGEPLFPGRQGRLSDSQVQADIKRLLQRAGINSVRQSPHTLRHTFSTVAYLAGCDWDAVELLLRHKEKKRNMTNRYIHLSPEQRLELMREKLEIYSPLRIVYRSATPEKASWVKSQILPSSALSRVLAPDPAMLLPDILDQMIALGQQSQELKHALGGNGHWPEQMKEITQYLTKAANHGKGLFGLVARSPQANLVTQKVN